MLRHLRSSSWVWLLTLFTVAGLVEVVFWGQVTAFTPLYLSQLGYSEDEVIAWTGAVAAISTMVGLPFLPFWGALADRYSRKPVIVRSFVAHMLAGLVMVSAGGNIWVFMLGRSLSSLALGNSGLMMTTLSERTPHNRLGLAFGVMNGAPPVGLFLGPLVGGPIVDQFGFPTLVLIDAVLLLAVIAALIFGYTDNFKGHSTGSLMQMALGSIGLIWQSPRLRALFPALFLLQAGWMLAYTYVSLVVQQVYQGNDPATATGIVVGAGGFIALVISPILGSLGDRYGYWRMLFISSIIAVFLWPIGWFTRDIVTFTVAWATINGLSSGMFAISFTVLANSASPNIRGRVMTFSYLPVNLGFAVGPAIGAVVTQVSLFAVFPTAAVITLLGVLALFFASKQQMVGEVAPTSAVKAT